MINTDLTVDTDRFVKEAASGSAKPLYEMTPGQARQVLLDIQSKPVAKEDVRIDDYDFPLGNDKTLPVRIVRPHSAKAENLPIIFYIHGGGWVMGDAATHDRLVRELSVGTEAAVVFPVYSPAPEAQYPGQIKELFSVLKYLAKEAAAFGLDASKLVVAGDSVGGNMATVMALMAKENNGPKIIFQLLLYPVTSALMDTASYQEFAEGPWLTRKAMEWFWDCYISDPSQRREITASPLLAEVEQLEGLPPALIITDENDVLRDEGEAYARKLIKAGVEVSSVRVNNTIHDFMMLNPLAKSKPARLAINLSITILRRLFYRDRL